MEAKFQRNIRKNSNHSENIKQNRIKNLRLKEVPVKINIFRKVLLQNFVGFRILYDLKRILLTNKYLKCTF